MHKELWVSLVIMILNWLKLSQLCFWLRYLLDWRNSQKIKVKISNKKKPPKNKVKKNMFKLADLHFQLNWCEMAKEHQVHKNGLKKLVCGKIFLHLFKEFKYFFAVCFNIWVKWCENRYFMQKIWLILFFKGS